jgi:hypothetical protein
VELVAATRICRNCRVGRPHAESTILLLVAGCALKRYFFFFAAFLAGFFAAFLAAFFLVAIAKLLSRLVGQTHQLHPTVAGRASSAGSTTRLTEFF